MGTITERTWTILRPYSVSCDQEELISAASFTFPLKGYGSFGRAFERILKDFPTAGAIRDCSRIIDYDDSDDRYVPSLVETADGSRTSYVRGNVTALLEYCGELGIARCNGEDIYARVLRTFTSQGLLPMAVARRQEGKQWECLGIIP